MSHRQKGENLVAPDPRKSRRVLFFVGLGSFFLGAMLAYAIFSVFYIHSHGDAMPIRHFEKEYSFINPLLECDVAQGTIDKENVRFKKDMEGFVSGIEDRGGADLVGVYFRDLNNGPAFGINGDDPFIPASLLKVPVMMAWFSYTEDAPDILEKKIDFPARYPDFEPGVQRIKPKEEITAPGSYTADELIRRAVVYSDNQAVTLLIEHIPPHYLRNLFSVLGVPQDVWNGPDGRLSVKEYASFFRILYNSSFLDRKLSNRALSLLAETDFHDGLVSGVPENIIVAHKFGEAGDDTSHQIHDCGIVYYPKHPYILCVMTRGKTIDGLSGVIASISRFVYGKVDEQFGPLSPDTTSK